jgi:molecular chaperone GrpE
VSETDEAPPGTVLTVLRPGYGGTDTILRPAAVVVSRAVNADRG